MTSVLGCGGSRLSSLQELLFEAVPRLLGTTNYLYDGMDATANVVQEVDGAGSTLATFVQELAIDAPLSMLRSSVATYFERDGLGSVTSLSDSSDILANAYTFASFGELVSSTGTVETPFNLTYAQVFSERECVKKKNHLETLKMLL
ncbi:MAG TPA: hypothetical protein VMG82_05760 [Candidatus Sulfotelmatobacter sp.]|nr:hypothetical protein [Candidatus Sulfotelmatobacter sp.]